MRIKTRILFSLIGANLLVFSVLWAVLQNMVDDALYEQTVRRGEALQLALVAPCAIAIANHEIENIDYYVGRLMRARDKNLDLEYVAVLDYEGRILSHSDETQYMALPEGRFYRDAVSRSATSHRVFFSASHGGREIIEIAAPILSGIRWGTLVAGFQAAPLREAARTLNLRLLLGVLIILLITSAAVYVSVAHNVVEPIRLLAEAAEQAGRLHFRYLPEDRFPGEFQQLVTAFSWMGTELKRHNETLNRLIADRTASLETALEKVEVLSRIDELTGLANRRYYSESVQREIRLAQRTGAPLGLLVIDVDQFKVYNDKNGHPAGDRLLKNLGHILLTSVRGTDVVGRVGGEEFSVGLVGSDMEESRVVAEKIRKRVEDWPFEFGATQPLGCVTISVGVASSPSCTGTYLELFTAADEALYQAKAGGRNQVRTAHGPSEGA